MANNKSKPARPVTPPAAAAKEKPGQEPDYSETLARTAQAVGEIGQRIEAHAESAYRDAEAIDETLRIQLERLADYTQRANTLARLSLGGFWDVNDIALVTTMPVQWIEEASNRAGFPAPVVNNNVQNRRYRLWRQGDVQAWISG